MVDYCVPCQTVTEKVLISSTLAWPEVEKHIKTLMSLPGVTLGYVISKGAKAPGNTVQRARLATEEHYDELLDEYLEECTKTEKAKKRANASEASMKSPRIWISDVRTKDEIKVVYGHCNGSQLYALIQHRRQLLQRLLPTQPLVTRAE